MNSIVARLRTASPRQRSLLTAAAAVFSALLSNYLPGPFTVFEGAVLPGVYFGVVVAAALYLFGGRSLLAIAGVMLVIVIVWIAALQGTIHIHEALLQGMRDQAKGSTGPLTQTAPYVLAISGLLGGLIGSAGTTFAVSLICPELRNVATWARTIILGTLAGLLLEAPSQVGLLPLFLVWQAAVAASLAYGIVPRVNYPVPQTASPI
jgi:hypothetical protein